MREEVIRSKIIKDIVFKKNKGKCWYCSVLLTRTGRNIKTDFSIEHLVPFSRGGKHDLINLVASCNSCNQKKKNKTVDEYIKYLSKKKLLTRSLVSKYGGYRNALKNGKEQFSSIANTRWRKGSKKQTVLEMKKLGGRGGQTTKERHGTEYFRKLAKKRHRIAKRSNIKKS